MARSVNKVILLGHLGSDPDVRAMPNGDSVANVSIATSQQWKDRDTGELKEQTEWTRLVFFRKLADVVGQYLHKGSHIFIEGRLRTRQWEKDGQTHYSTEVIVDELVMLDRKPADGQQTNSAPASNSSKPNAYRDARGGGSNRQAPAEDDLDDDIPF